jgi:glycosyltransferase involved in cell wall biosynthesis/cephalosporin hydroxylase
MRIAFISTWKAFCGISTYTMHLAEELAKKHEVMIFAEERDVSGYDDSQNGQIPFMECWNRYTGFSRLLHEVRRFEPDVVHVQHEFSIFHQNEQMSGEFLDVCRKIEPPLVITYHTIPIPTHRYWTPPENPVQRVLLESLRGRSEQSILPVRLRREIAAMIYEPAVRRFFAETDEIFARKIVHTQVMRNLAVTRYGLSNVAFINHGVTPCMPLSRKECRRRLGIPEDSIVITSFGFVSESKGLMELIEVIRELEESEGTPVRFYHVGGLHGTGFGKPYLKQCLKKIETMDSIKITGYVPEEELPEYYSASDIFILNYQPGTAASASGWTANLMGTMRPLLTTEGTNRTDEIIHNYNCMKVPYKDRQAMLKAIRNLISNDALYSRIVAKAREYSQENSWDKIAKKHEAVYEELVGNEIPRATQTTLKNAFTLPRTEPQTFEDLKTAIYETLPRVKGWCDAEKACAMMNLVSEVQPDVCIEIGVFAGASALPTAAALKFLGHGVLLAIDPWDNEESTRNLLEGAIKEWWNDVDMDRIYRAYLRLVHEFGLEKYCVTLKETSASAAPKISAIDILHIDGNHSEASSFFDVFTYLPKVKHGGYVWFDDPDWTEGHDQIPTTKKAVDFLENSCTLVKAYSSNNYSWRLFRKN